MDINKFAALGRALAGGSRRHVLARAFSLMLVALVSVPVTVLMTEPDTRTALKGDLSAVAKGKSKKKAKPKAPQYTTVTRTVRQLVAQKFANPEVIAVPGAAPAVLSGRASPYPSAIQVSGFASGSTLTDVNVVLYDFAHVQASDVDILLAHPDQTNRNALVLSDGQPAAEIDDIDLTLDDEAATPLLLGQWSSGSFQPTNVTATATDTFPGGPTGSGDVALSVFDGTNPNGTWQLWVRDDSDSSVGDFGDIGGWALQITAEHEVQIQELVPVPTKDKKKKGKGRR